jgi:hypothetical protein
MLYFIQNIRTRLRRAKNGMSNHNKRNIVKVVTKTRLGEEPSAAAYWRAQTYQVRLEALEQIRQEYHEWKYNAQPRFQRVYSIVKR